MKSDDNLLKGKTETLPYFVAYVLHGGHHEERVDAADEKAANATIRQQHPEADHMCACRGVVAVYWRSKGTKGKWAHCNQTGLLDHLGHPSSFQEQAQDLRDHIAYITKAPHYVMLLSGGLEAHQQKQTPEFTCRVYNSSIAIPEEI